MGVRAGENTLHTVPKGRRRNQTIKISSMHVTAPNYPKDHFEIPQSHTSHTSHPLVNNKDLTKPI